jgi:hypothetical protein
MAAIRGTKLRALVDDIARRDELLRQMPQFTLRAIAKRHGIGINTALQYAHRSRAKQAAAFLDRYRSRVAAGHRP